MRSLSALALSAALVLSGGAAFAVVKNGDNGPDELNGTNGKDTLRGKDGKDRLMGYGGNDLLRKRDEQELARNLRAMVEAARSRGIAVVLVGVPAPGLLLSVPELYAALAEEQRLPYEAEALRTILGDRALKSDPVHPNAEGYRQFAQRLHALLRGACAL